MRVSRIYQDSPLAVGQEIQLDGQAAVHVARVLRLRVGDALVVFNGQGGEFHGEIRRMDKKAVHVALREHKEINVESPLQIVLAQGVSRGERMDFTVQKAVELGIHGIVPLLTERSVVNLNAERKDRRRHHWQTIVAGACEQSGRNFVPPVEEIRSLPQWLQALEARGEETKLEANRFVLNHRAERGMADLQLDVRRPVYVLIGPEGGLAETEIAQAQQAGFVSIRLGARVLRTETAALAFIAAMQAKWGDFV